MSIDSHRTDMPICTIKILTGSTVSIPNSILDENQVFFPDKNFPNKTFIREWKMKEAQYLR